MSDTFIVAIPSITPGGLDAEVSGHFGHCDLYTLVEVEDGIIGAVSTLPSIPHEQGSCLAPVSMLAQKEVKALIAGGMGMRPLAGFNDAGIDVYFNNGINRVVNLIDAFVQGRLPKFTMNNTCGGGNSGGCGGH